MWALSADGRDQRTRGDYKEFRPSQFKGRSVDLYLNSICNLKCKTCFLGDDYFSKSASISVSDVESILYWCKNAGVQDIAFLGGEPSLHPNISDILKLSKQVGIPVNRVISNGTAPFRRLIRSDAREYVDFVNISLDGPTRESNDAIRGNGTYQQVIRSMGLLAAYEVPFNITASIAQNSLNHLSELIRLAEDSCCRTLNIHWVSPSGRARNGASSISPSNWMRLCQEVMQHSARRPNFSIQCQVAYMDSANSWLGSLIDESACAVRDKNNLQFMPDGSVHACGLTTDRPGLNGYFWENGSLYVNSAENELTICQSAPERGCPIRRSILVEPVAPSNDVVQICIYERVFNGNG